MDLMKHMGKENQIQNYRLIEKMQYLKEQLSIIQAKNKINSELSIFKMNSQGDQEIYNINQLNQLKHIVNKIQFQAQSWENHQK